MIINIKLSNGKTISIKCSDNILILDLINQICKEEMDLPNIILEFSGQKLDDTKILFYYKIEGNSLLILIMKYIKNLSN